MAKKNNSTRKHSSPGLYFTDTVVKYGTKSLGITSLGVVGETLKGRAFEPMTVNDWPEFVSNFGGTSTTKFKGSQYPKYELPYIAQSYLEQSHNLKVVRVLGLSGTNAGTAWVVTAHGTDNSEYDNMVVLVLRSRGEHKKAAFVQAANPEEGICNDVYEYDGIHYYAKYVELVPSKTLNLGQDCNPGYNAEEGNFNVDALNYGTFTIKVTLNDEMADDPDLTKRNYKYYSVTLNPSDKNYIYNVIGGEPDKGDAEIYVEELYDVALRQLVNRNLIDAINQTVVTYENVNIVPAYEDVYDILTDSVPTRNMLGRRYLYSITQSVNEEGENIPVKYSSDNGTTWIDDEPVNGMIYTVMMELDPVTNKRSFFYGTFSETTGCTKVVSAEDASEMYHSYHDLGEPKYLKDYNSVKVATANDVVAIEMGTPEKKVKKVSFKIYYDGKVLTPMEGCLGTIGTIGEDGSFNVGYGETVPQDFDFWQLLIHLDEDIDWATSGMNYEDPSKVQVVINSSNTVNNSEQLLVYNYDQVDDNRKFTNCVRVAAENSFYINNEGTDVTPITLDFNNYKEHFRWASSPWIVSEMKGSAENVELNKLFRFHAISDGSNSTTEFKISIENIDPSTGKFDVLVRDYYDSDLSTNVLEKFTSCDMVPGSIGYIALKIGSTDGLYNSKSNYITVEVIENDITKSSIPAGFLGYPIRNYKGTAIVDSEKTVVAPYFEYNTNIDDSIKGKKQYFGVSDIVGIDEDVFKYKGVEAYDGNPDGLTPCFHLDARILNGKPDENGAVALDANTKQIVSVDGVTGYTWVTVNKNNTTSYGIEPRIGDEATMYGTIYEDKTYRKFTVAMYGGWDGWDYYRTVRSNGDEFRYKEYKGAISTASGYGTMFNVEKNPEAIGFGNGDKVITSDYYAYLAGVKQLGNPKSITVNVLATPGIDYVYNKALVDEIIDIVEEDRGDLIYVITTPDKPLGAGDSEDEMYSADEVVYNLEDSDIDSNHCCTYYPWVKYYDEDNYQYIFLPLTRDVVRSIAYTDNVKFSWYANAGWNRGNIPSNASPRKKLTLGEQDTLYDGRINFVNSFAEEGNKIWGDKNLQIDDNLLNRISKRRLLLRIRTMLQNSCIGLIFDPNDLTISQTVRSAVSKVLDEVKKGRGITDYKIDIDDSPETRDQLGLNVTYHIKPIQALEWINFTSVLTPEGMEW